MTNRVVITFVKNAVLGTVKTRLADTIGDENALTIYKKLLQITEDAIRHTKSDHRIYFSSEIDNNLWKGLDKFTQRGADLGERIQNAFQECFDAGYEQVVIVGSDLPDLDSAIIEEAFENLDSNDVVIGPSLDGGYYLLGQSKMHSFIFEDMAWSQENLFDQTIDKLISSENKYSLLKSLNDIDTIEDLKNSSLYSEVKHLTN